MFYETDNIFEALAGILKTAKKYNVVDFEGDTLFQGTSDKVIITLLKEAHEGMQANDVIVRSTDLIRVNHVTGIEVKRRKKASAIGGKAPSTTGFGQASGQHQQQKCHICAKTVYPMEYVGAADKVSHQHNVCTGESFFRRFTRTASAA